MADPIVFEMVVQLIEVLLGAQQLLMGSYYQLQFEGMEHHQAMQKPINWILNLRRLATLFEAFSKKSPYQSAGLFKN